MSQRKINLTHKNLIDNNRTNFHYRYLNNKLPIIQNSRYQQQQYQNNDANKYQENAHNQHDQIINNPQRKQVQNFGKSKNAILNYSPFHYQSTYQRNYLQHRQDYQPNDINKYKPKNRKGISQTIINPSKFNNLQSLTSYNADYALPSTKNNKVKAILETNQGIYHPTAMHSHRYGKQTIKRLRTQTNPIGSSYNLLKLSKLDTQTQYKKKFIYLRQTNIFKQQNTTNGQINYKQYSSKRRQRLITQPNLRISKQSYNFKLV